MFNCRLWGVLETKGKILNIMPISTNIFTKIVVKRISASITSVLFLIGGRYKSIKAVGKACGVNVPIRRGFAFIDEGHALYFAKLVDKTIWNNSMNSVEDTIIEKKVKPESLLEFQKRVCGSPYYDANLLRFCFVKDSVSYKFTGVFRLASIDFENRQVVFKKVLFSNKVNITVQQTITARITIKETITT